MKQAIRNFAIWLRALTDEWVIPRDLTAAMLDLPRDEAARRLDEREALWPRDPEIVRARSLLSFLHDD